SLSTLADQVGGCCAVLAPLLGRVKRHVFAAERLHSDDTTVPVLAKGKTDTGRCWGFVRGDRPFGGAAPPGARFCFFRRRGGEHVLSLARSGRGAGPIASGQLCRDLPGRCLWRVQQAVRGRPQAGPDRGGGVLGACPPTLLPDGRSRCECPPKGARQNAGGDL